MKYTAKTAMESLGLRSKAELARLCECSVQSLYMTKGENLTSKLNLVVRLLVRNKEQSQKIADLEHVITTKNEIIKALR